MSVNNSASDQLTESYRNDGRDGWPWFMAMQAMVVDDRYPIVLPLSGRLLAEELSFRDLVLDSSVHWLFTSARFLHSL